VKAVLAGCLWVFKIKQCQVDSILRLLAGGRMIFNWIFEVVKWFWQLWDRLDEKTKRQIIEAIIKAFGELLRAFYRQWKNRKDEGKS